MKLLHRTMRVHLGLICSKTAISVWITNNALEALENTRTMIWKLLAENSAQTQEELAEELKVMYQTIFKQELEQKRSTTGRGTSPEKLFHNNARLHIASNIKNTIMSHG